MKRKKVYYSNVPDKFHYWEVISAWTMGIDVNNIFLRSKKKKMVHSRFFCIKFMLDELKLSVKDISDRYGLERNDILRGRERLNFLISINKEIDKKYLTFLELCNKYRPENKENILVNEILSVDEVKSLKKVAHSTWLQIASLIHLINEYEKDETNKSEIIDRLILTEINFNIIKQFFIK